MSPDGEPFRERKECIFLGLGTLLGAGLSFSFQKTLPRFDPKIARKKATMDQGKQPKEAPKIVPKRTIPMKFVFAGEAKWHTWCY